MPPSFLHNDFGCHPPVHCNLGHLNLAYPNSGPSPPSPSPSSLKLRFTRSPSSDEGWKAPGRLREAHTLEIRPPDDTTLKIALPSLPNPRLSPVTPDKQLHSHTALTTDNSLPSKSNVLPLNLKNVMARLEPLLERNTTSAPTEISINGVTPDIVEELRMKFKESGRFGWENLRYDDLCEMKPVRNIIILSQG